MSRRFELADDDELAKPQDPTVHVRVEFLRVRPEPGERLVVHVVVPHISRADSVAREQAGGLRHDEWCILSVVEGTLS